MDSANSEMVCSWKVFLGWLGLVISWLKGMLISPFRLLISKSSPSSFSSSSLNISSISMVGFFSHF